MFRIVCQKIYAVKSFRYVNKEQKKKDAIASLIFVFIYLSEI